MRLFLEHQTREEEQIYFNLGAQQQGDWARGGGGTLPRATRSSEIHLEDMYQRVSATFGAHSDAIPGRRCTLEQQDKPPKKQGFLTNRWKNALWHSVQAEAPPPPRAHAVGRDHVASGNPKMVTTKLGHIFLFCRMEASIQPEHRIATTSSCVYVDMCLCRVCKCVCVHVCNLIAIRVFRGLAVAIQENP